MRQRYRIVHVRHNRHFPRRINLWKVLGYFLVFILVSLIISRLVLPREIDDLHPNIPCEDEYIMKSEVLWVVPNFRGAKISENPEWCQKVLSYNKTLGLHGINHTYKEFETNNISESELLWAAEEFEKCFGYAPTMFKPPQLAINEENKNLVREYFELKLWFNQVTRRVYHCDNDTTTNEFGGILPNTFYDYI